MNKDHSLYMYYCSRRYFLCLKHTMWAAMNKVAFKGKRIPTINFKALHEERSELSFTNSGSTFHGTQRATRTSGTEADTGGRWKVGDTTAVGREERSFVGPTSSNRVASFFFFFFSGSMPVGGSPPWVRTRAGTGPGLSPKARVRPGFCLARPARSQPELWELCKVLNF